MGIMPREKYEPMSESHPHLRGVVLARLEDVRALLDELQQWSDSVSHAAEQAGAQSAALSEPPLTRRHE